MCLLPFRSEGQAIGIGWRAWERFQSQTVLCVAPRGLPRLLQDEYKDPISLEVRIAC